MGVDPATTNWLVTGHGGLAWDLARTGSHSYIASDHGSFPNRGTGWFRAALSSQHGIQIGNQSVALRMDVGLGRIERKNTSGSRAWCDDSTRPTRSRLHV